MFQPSTPRLPARLSPRPLRTVSRRLMRSGFARDLARDRYFIAGYSIMLLCALLVVILTQGTYVAWDGVHSIPTGGAR